MLVRQIPVGPMANLVYLASDEKTNESIVVDSGWETKPVVEAVREARAVVKFVVATHSHFDHVSSTTELARELEAETVAHRDAPVDCDIRVGGGAELRLGRTKVRVLHTPGHTPDSICLYDGREVFTGDTLFVGTIGKFGREDAETIFKSIHDVIMKLPPSTVMYPGHDYGEVKSRSLGEEASANPFLMAPDLRSFVSLFG